MPSWNTSWGSDESICVAPCASCVLQVKWNYQETACRATCTRSDACKSYSFQPYKNSPSGKCSLFEACSSPRYNEDALTGTRKLAQSLVLANAAQPPPICLAPSSLRPQSFPDEGLEWPTQSSCVPAGRWRSMSLFGDEEW